ncbi:MAG: hypothetical protein K2M70_11060 [Lachnospiraceae bacterium]|nr:hypothetical protein [Lachnospiraceae bacterium]
MLHILLLLLKIIGIIILCILGTIILMLLGFLFVPVRYRIEVSRKEVENEPPVVVRAKVTWLLHFFNVLVRYSTEFYLRVRLLFIPVFRLPRKEKKEAGKRRKKEERKEQKEEEREEKPKGKAEEREEKPEEVAEKREKEAAEHGKEYIEESSKQVRDEKKEDDFVHKLRALWEKIRNFIENIQYTIRNICDKIKAIWNNIQYYSDLVKSDVFQNTFQLCKKELCRLLKGVLPGTFEADLVVGMDDPAATGQILAVCGMLYPVLGGHINVVGDFEQKRLEGRIFMKGRIYGITLLYVCVKIYFNENVKKLYKLLKKEAV